MVPGIHKILVSTDFSPMSEYATEYAMSLAAALGASVCVTHVLEQPYPQGVWDFYVPPSPEQEARIEQAARAEMLKIAERFGGPSLHVATDIRTGIAAEEIVRAAREFGADLVVMATHGRTGLTHLLLGSVAERVIRRAACPVLAVRMPLAQAGVPAGDAARVA